MQAKVVEVIRTDTVEGEGTEESPVCKMRRYWTLEGELISEQIYAGEGARAISETVADQQLHKPNQHRKGRQGETGREDSVESEEKKVAYKKLERTQQHEPIVQKIEEMIQEEYDTIKADSKNYAEVVRKYKKRSAEIAYRYPDIGRCMRKKFEECFEKDMEELECSSDKGDMRERGE